MSTAAHDSVRAPARGVAVAGVLLWIAMIIIAIVGYFWTILRMFSLDGCGGICREDLIFGAIGALPWSIVAAFVIAIILAFVLNALGRRIVWAPLTGVGLLVVSLVTINVALTVGFAPIFERNSRPPQGVSSTAPVAPDPVGIWGAGGREQPQLQIVSDGTLTGTDGCNSFTGRWEQNADGTIALAMAPTSHDSCAGIDAWLAQATSAEIRDNYLFGRNSAGSTIGGLAPLH